jgi:hypothetical protein
MPPIQIIKATTTPVPEVFPLAFPTAVQAHSTGIVLREAGHGMSLAGGEAFNQATLL